jgi:hypothetical protein
MATISKGATRRTTKRLARVRLENPKALPRVKADNKYTPRERRKVLKAAKALPKDKKPSKGPAKKKPVPYSPTAALTGPREKQEMAAAERLQFGPQREELVRAEGQQQQTITNTGSYYDDYRKALDEASTRVNMANQAAIQSQQARVDATADFERARVEQKDQAAAQQASKLGFNSAGASAEGAQAVTAARSQGTQQVGTMRSQAAADEGLNARRSATSVQAKAEALTKENARLRDVQKQRQELAAKRGAFRTDFRRQVRKDEREWSAIKQEFGLKEQELKQEAKTDRASQQTERMKANAQKIVARMYASADRAGAKAQIRVAQLQLKKGKISQHQFRTIKNVYSGLPKKPSKFDFNYSGGGSGSGGGGGAGGGGGGAGGSSKKPLQTWEKDKVSNAVRILSKNRAKGADRGTWIKRMQDEGVPLRLARIAWQRYYGKTGVIDRPSNARGPRGQGARPT